MKLKICRLVSPGIIVLLISLYFARLYFVNNREKHLIEKGNNIIEKVENFKEINNRLPISLNELGLNGSGKWSHILFNSKRQC